MMRIDKGVPLLDTKYQRYPFRAMEIGDSFAFPVEKMRSVIQSAAQQKIRNKIRFVVRKTSETEARCWRVE